MKTDRLTLIALVGAAVPCGILFTFCANVAAELLLRTGEVIAAGLILASLAQTLGEAFARLQ